MPRAISASPPLLLFTPFATALLDGLHSILLALPLTSVDRTDEPAIAPPPCLPDLSMLTTSISANQPTSAPCRAAPHLGRYMQLPGVEIHGALFFSARVAAAHTAGTTLRTGLFDDSRLLAGDRRVTDFWRSDRRDGVRRSDFSSSHRHRELGAGGGRDGGRGRSGGKLGAGVSVHDAAVQVSVQYLSFAKWARIKNGNARQAYRVYETGSTSKGMSLLLDVKVVVNISASRSPKQFQI